MKSLFERTSDLTAVWRKKAKSPMQVATLSTISNLVELIAIMLDYALVVSPGVIGFIVMIQTGNLLCSFLLMFGLYSGGFWFLEYQKAKQKANATSNIP